MLARAGFGSRRKMEEAIAAGRITVNGKLATTGLRVSGRDRLLVDGVPMVKSESPRNPTVLLYHKPAGEMVTEHDPKGRPTIFHRLPRIAGRRWIAVGRLDFNTSGVLLVTDSGDLANRLMHPSSGLEREYAVRVLGEMSPAQLELLRTGVTLDDGTAAFQKIRFEGGGGANRWYRVILTEGRNREVRRMFEAVGLMVSRLTRIRYGPIGLPPRLARGRWVKLSGNEVVKLLQSCSGRVSGVHSEPAMRR